MIVFLLGIILCGLKFPFNWIWDDAKFTDIKKTSNFGLYDGERLQDAWRRITEDGRLLHDATNLAIEWNRQWLPVSTKFFCALFVWSNLLWLAWVILT